MKPWEHLGRASTADGREVRLSKRDTEYAIFADNRLLMSSRMHGSEEQLAALACRDAAAASGARVLVGGLGMGFTLRAALDLLGRDAEVIVAELLTAVIEWNRGPLAPLAAHPLSDPRVHVDARDVATVMRTHPRAFDAILLDVDNGPAAFTAAANDSLYGDAGIALAHASLRPHGALAVWSAWQDRAYERRLRRRGFQLETSRVHARAGQRGARHVIYVARKADASGRMG